MKSQVIAAGLLATVSQATAADFPAVPQSAPIAAPTRYNWSGIYVGANAGYGFAAKTTDVSFNGSQIVTQREGSLAGAFAGGQVGANYQFGIGVIGIEVDGQWSGQKGNKVTDCDLGFPCSFTDTATIDSFATARVRVGAALDRVLLYGTAGAAWTSYNENITSNVLGLTSGLLSTTGSKVGLAVGAGVEVGITPFASVKAEYLYLATDGLVSNGTFPAAFGGGAITETVKFRDSIARLGLNVRFGGS